MKNEILLFYNKNTNKIIGFHHPILSIVSNINDSFIYKRRNIDVRIFLQIFTSKKILFSDVNKRKLKYFNNLKINDIGHKYLDYNMVKRRMKLNKIIQLIDG